MSRYLQWSRREHPESTRVAVLALVAPVFLGLLPALVAGAGPRLDRTLGQRPRGPRVAARILGGLLAVAGFGLGFWSVQSQLDRGRGTPLPVMPTQELLTDGPFRYCRNPMTLGAILAYLGIAIAARSPSGTGFVVAFAAALLAYLRCLEEPELAERFGDAYVDYKRSTPFIIPVAPRCRTQREPEGGAIT
jgi:protein-S-isoprenylcysteine O-methyltransferase Ste14